MYFAHDDEEDSDEEEAEEDAVAAAVDDASLIYPVTEGPVHIWVRRRSQSRPSESHRVEGRRRSTEGKR